MRRGPRKPPSNNGWPTGPWGGGATPGGPQSGGSTPAPQIPAGSQSAWAVLEQMLQDYGLTSLSEWLKSRILTGLDENSIYLELQQTNEWKRRFAGNEMLRANGLAVLSPGEYLALERSYAQIMRNYGLPEGFYDDPSDFAKWIGNSVSAAELQQRVAGYSDLMNRSEDTAIRDQLSSMGLGNGDLLAMWMDPSRAAPLIQQKYQTALLGGAARRAGLSGSEVDNGYLGQLVGRGVTEQQASQGYGLIAGSLDTARTLAAVYGTDYDLRDMESEVFDNNAASGKKRRRLASQERASFSGSGGVGRLGSDSAGSY